MGDCLEYFLILINFIQVDRVVQLLADNPSFNPGLNQLYCLHIFRIVFTVTHKLFKSEFTRLLPSKY